MARPVRSAEGAALSLSMSCAMALRTAIACAPCEVASRGSAFCSATRASWALPVSCSCWLAPDRVWSTWSSSQASRLRDRSWYCCCSACCCALRVGELAGELRELAVDLVRARQRLVGLVADLGGGGVERLLPLHRKLVELLDLAVQHEAARAGRAGQHHHHAPQQHAGGTARAARLLRLEGREGGIGRRRGPRGRGGGLGSEALLESLVSVMREGTDAACAA